MNDNGTFGIDKLQGFEQNDESLPSINTSDPNKMQCICRKFIGNGRYNSAHDAVLRQPNTVYMMNTPDIVAIFGSSGQQYIRTPHSETYPMSKVQLQHVGDNAK